ncbi:hypothetical protein MMC28_002471 [Mycoblastus sanguinarius]|nr:hypothetical protein [Mycoblastus sanguinarius]
MPPFIPYKRRLSTPPTDSPTTKSTKKPSLFDTADKPGASASLQDNKTFLDQLNAPECESSLSDVSSEDFEDALPAPSSKKRKIAHDEDDDEIDWEDAIHPGATPPTGTAPSPSGDLELTLQKSALIGSLTNPHDKKKGPSKIERQIRVSAHCTHVQFLLFHNLIRNGWACDPEVQRILVGQLPPGVKKEVEKWKTDTGLNPETLSGVGKTPPRKGKRGKKETQSERNQRDWGRPAEKQEKGAPSMSRGDPLIRLLKVLAAYWKKRFTVTAPGLRKQGYRSLASLEEDIASYRNDKHDPEKHGERVRGLQEFRALAKACEGSRDVGAQLFTTLIRGLGLEARQVASLQPVGFGWSKNEEVSESKKKATKAPKSKDSDDEVVSNEGSGSDVAPAKNSSISKLKFSTPSKEPPIKKRRSKGAKDVPIDLSEDSSDDAKEDVEGEDDESVVDVTPSTPRKRPSMNYDRDMSFPTYWTEVISPITNEVYPVDPLVLSPAVATNAEQLALFESRGAKADKAKQVFAYVIAYSSDGTAKDVITRYLKKHMWPGRTKGVRMPVEKVPVYNKRGKIKHYEEYDWVKTLMGGYNRTSNIRTIVDDIEEAKDLKAVKPDKKEPKASDDTLQGYKNSAEFVLQRHLRREEAIRPGSEPVKTFTAGKGENAKEEPVYRRKDVEICRTGESWHKEGRAVKPGEHPMKMVPVRAVTLTRKREVEEAERDTGEKLKQGLYAWHQTDWIIPPPIENGVIPKNAFGNMDCYVPTMVPKGAVHIPLRSTVRICKKLGIDYAEAVTGFEFGNKRAVPVITGVVVAEENENAVIDIWEKEEEERRIKEEGKREKAALATWRKWLMGLRIIERVREEYGGDADAHLKEEMNPFTNQSKAKKAPRTDIESKGQSNGGMLDYVDEDVEGDLLAEDTIESGGFLVGEDIEGGGFLVDEDIEGGGFLPEGHDEEELPHSKSELTIENERHFVERNSMSISPPPPSTAALTSNDQQRNRHHETANDGQNTQREQEEQAKPAANVKGPRKAKGKQRKAATPKKPLTNGKERKLATRLEHSEDDEGMGTSGESAPPRHSARSAPKRKAARTSASAVKSHYFEHDSDEEEPMISGSSAEEETVKQPARRRKAVVAPTNGRSLRARKSA